MRHIFALPLIFVSLVWLNAARADAGAQPELISYSELMSLSAEKRVAYIEGVQHILIELSKNKDGRFSDRDPKARSKMKAMMEWLDREMNAAVADDAPAAPQTCQNNPKCRLQAARCFGQGKSVKWDGANYACDSTAQTGAPSYKNWTEQMQKLADPQFPVASTSAPAAAQAAPMAAVESETIVLRPASEKALSVSQPEPRPFSLSGKSKKYETEREFINAENIDIKNYSCRSKYRSGGGPGVEALPTCGVSQEEALEAEFKPHRSILATNATRGISLTPAAASEVVAEKAADKSEAKAEPATTTSDATPSETKVTGKEYGPKVLRSTVQELLAQKKAPNDLCLEEAKKQGQGAMDLVAVGADYRCMTKSAEQMYDNKKLMISDGDEAIPAGREVRTQNAKTAKPANAAAKTATGKVYACAPKPQVCEDSKSRAKVFPGEQKCVFAGMFSKFDGQNRKCEPVTEFKLADANFKCDSGQTMCNPLLFGVVSSTKPICVGRGSNATEMCASPKMSSPRDAERFINQNASGLVEKWNEFKADFASTCAPETPSAKFHCAECNIIQARVFELNAKILFNPCGSRSTGTDVIGAKIQIRKNYPDNKSGTTVK